MRRRALALALSVILIAPAARAADPPEAKPAATYQSPGRRIAGIVLTSIAAAGIVAGSITIGVTAHASEDARLSGFTYGGLGIGTGVLFAVIGIPLWVMGSRPPSLPAASSRLRPEIAIGPGSGSLRWVF